MSWTFALVTPDAVVAGRLGFVLEQLAAFGLAVRACRIVTQDWARMARLYTHLDDPPPTVGGGPEELPATVMRPLYQLAPGVVLAVHGTCEQLLACKGATRPERAAADTIRAAGEHLIFNFLHCPDDARSAAIELAYLLDPADAAALRVLAEAPEPLPGSAWCGPDDLADLLPAFAGPTAIAFPAIANRLRGRILQALAPRAGVEALDALLWAHGVLASERDGLRTLGDQPAAARLELAARVSADIHEPLKDALAAADAGLPVAAWGAALDALAGYVDPDGPRPFAPIEALPAHGIYVSALELVALDAHRHAHFRPERPPTRVPPRGEA